MSLEFASDQDLLDRLSTRFHDLAFLVGSAVTAPARPGEPGVPLATDVIKLIRGEFQQPHELQRFEAALVAEPGNQYQAAFRFLLKTRDLDTANVVIRRAVLQSRKPSVRFPPIPSMYDDTLCRELERDLDGWCLPPAVEALGRLLASTPAAAKPLVLTSNFDPLVAISIRRAGGHAFTTALHGDGSLAGVDGDGTQVVHFHGDWFRTDTLHTLMQLGQSRPRLAASLTQLLNKRTLVVLGYSGWDDVFTRSLEEAIRGGLVPIKVAWSFYSDDEVKIGRDRARLLTALDPGVKLGRVVLYKGINVHDLLPRLAARLETSRGQIFVTPEADESLDDDTRPTMVNAYAPTFPEGLIAGERHVPDPFLVVVYGANLGRKYVLNRSEVTIGRGIHSDIQIDEAGMSDTHAMLSVRAGDIWISAGAPAQAVYIYESRLVTTECRLARNTRLRVGRTIFRLLSGPDAVRSYRRLLLALEDRDGLTWCQTLTGLRKQLDALPREAESATLAVIMFDFEVAPSANVDCGVAEFILGITAYQVREEIPDQYLFYVGGTMLVALVPPNPNSDPMNAAKKIRRRFKPKYVFQGSEFSVVVSMGVAMYKAGIESSDALLRQAEILLQKAKSARCDCIVTDDSA